MPPSPRCQKLGGGGHVPPPALWCRRLCWVLGLALGLVKVRVRVSNGGPSLSQTQTIVQPLPVLTANVTRYPSMSELAEIASWKPWVVWERRRASAELRSECLRCSGVRWSGRRTTEVPPSTRVLQTSLPSCRHRRLRGGGGGGVGGGGSVGSAWPIGRNRADPCESTTTSRVCRRRETVPRNPSRVAAGGSLNQTRWRRTATYRRSPPMTRCRRRKRLNGWLKPSRSASQS